MTERCSASPAQPPRRRLTPTGCRMAKDSGAVIECCRSAVRVNLACKKQLLSAHPHDRAMTGSPLRWPALDTVISSRIPECPLAPQRPCLGEQAAATLNPIGGFTARRVNREPFEHLSQANPSGDPRPRLRAAASPPITAATGANSTTASRRRMLRPTQEGRCNDSGHDAATAIFFAAADQPSSDIPRCEFSQLARR